MSFSSFFMRIFRKSKLIPKIKICFTDLELTARSEAERLGFPIDAYEPTNVEFTFLAKSHTGAEVVTGKITVIHGRQVNLRMIETTPAFRRRGYGTATVIAIADHYRLPVVPVDERGAGSKFFAALRRRTKTAGFVKPEISAGEGFAMSASEAKERAGVERGKY